MISDACMDVLKSHGHTPNQLEFVSVWIMVREFKRRRGMLSDPATFDRAAKQAWDEDNEAAFEAAAGPDATAFADFIDDLLFSGWVLPGWDPSSCKMNWRRYACAMYVLASIEDKNRTNLTKMVKGGTQPILECPQEWLNLPSTGDELDLSVYDCEIPMPGVSCEPMGWKIFAYAAGAAVVAGLGWFLYQTMASPSQPSERQNPARKTSKFVVRMSNSENDSVLLVVQGPGAAKWAKEYKQSVVGSDWEADGPDFAYTIVSDYPDLVKDLKQKRYHLDQSEYSPPESENPAKKKSKTFKTFEDRSGHLLTLIGTANGNLTLRPTPEGVTEAKDMLELRDVRKRGSLADEADMLEWHISNGWDYVQPEEIGALTDATIISRDVERDDNGDLVRVGRVYAHMNYAVEDPIKTWANGKDVFFQGAE